MTGFSLPEVLFVVAVLGVLGAVGLQTVREYRDGTVAAKTGRGVRMLNEAASAYQLFGGSFEGVSTAVEAVARLKTVSDAASAKAMPGLTGSMVDPAFQLAPAGDAVAAGTAALRWVADERRFEEAVVPGAGGSRDGLFVIAPSNEAAAVAPAVEEVRHGSLAYAEQSEWIWDYGDGVAAIGGLSDRIAGAQVYEGTNRYRPASPQAGRLQPPMVTVPGGSFVLREYPIEVHLNDPNPRGTALVELSLRSGEWETYTGGAIPVSPGDLLRARCLTIDPDSWRDSETAEHTYATTPEELDLRLATPRPRVTYAELGGAMVAADGTTTVPSGDEAAISIATLGNLGRIPVAYRNSEVFEIAWHFGEGDPRFSPDARTGAPFTGGFAGQEIPLTLAEWGNRPAVPLAVKALSRNGHIVADSDVVSVTYQAEVVTPAPPAITPAGGTFDVGVTVTLGLGEGLYPVGSRILYTADGTPPTPTNGVPYTEPVLFSTPEVEKRFTIRAIVVPPGEVSSWFTLSGEATAAFQLKNNNGHGNNEDGVDVSNPGDGSGGPNGEDDPSGDIDDEIVR